jgi:hypothetical protein
MGIPNPPMQFDKVLKFYYHHINRPPYLFSMVSIKIYNSNAAEPLENLLRRFRNAVNKSGMLEILCLFKYLQK